MSDLDHRCGVKEENLVVRHLKLEGVTEQNKQGIIEDIDQITGIDSVSFDDESCMLNVAYDATHCNLDGIKECLEAHGAEVSAGWWTRFKEGYYKYVDQNVKDNDENEPTPRNSLPKALPGSKKH